MGILRKEIRNPRKRIKGIATMNDHADTMIGLAVPASIALKMGVDFKEVKWKELYLSVQDTDEHKQEWTNGLVYFGLYVHTPIQPLEIPKLFVKVQILLNSIQEFFPYDLTDIKLFSNVWWPGY